MERFDKVELPGGVSLDALLSKSKAKRCHALENDKAGIMYILHTLTTMSNSRKYRDYFEEHGGYPIHSNILNKLIGKRYTYLLELLEAEGVIERSPSYSTGNFSKAMRLTKAYAHSGTKWKSLPATSTVTRRIIAENEKRHRENIEALAPLGYITKWFDSGRLTIDTVKAHALIENYRVKLATLSKEVVAGLGCPVNLSNRIILRVNNMINTISRLQNVGFALTRTGKDNRLHSTLTNTKKALRRLYTFDGKPLVSIDIKASQPYLLAELLKPKSWDKHGLVHKVFPELYKKVSTRTNQSHLLSLLMFGGFSETHTGKGFPGEGLASVNWENDFYQSLVERASLQGCATVFPKRSVAKRKTMLLLFNDAWYTEQDEAFLLFAKWFPREAALISFLKKLTRSDKNAGVDEPLSYLPTLLQRVESYFILENVCKVLSLKYPDAPILPVHDCILTVPEYKDAFKSTIAEVLESLTGIRPGLTVDEYSDQLNTEMFDDIIQDEIEKLSQTKCKAVLPEQGLLRPLLLSPPDINGTWLVSDRYSIEGLQANKERVLVLVDDTHAQTTVSLEMLV
jgi:hypothetical protein